MKRRTKWKQESFNIPCFLFLYLNFLFPVFCSSIIWASSEDISRPKRLLGYRDARRVENDDLLKLSKVLRSVNEEEAPAVKSLETALQSIEEESTLHESRKRSKIAKVLADLEDHTKKALSNKKIKNGSKIRHLWSEHMPKNRKDGRTVTIDTVKGKKKVFIPKGWIFCTVSPLRCYSSRNRKRTVTKRHIQNHANDNIKKSKTPGRRSSKLHDMIQMF
ncbi:uncharacterized protein LOC116309029 [Actinia tenebrosa]|uniref:Uncharacterized protein LOC116309029 n=1 Tax=Actinia tenebrosa TaxID=6105 RepID=A0A6P8J6J8_ACTTE|nr:uncharacterized protein LOC116309029 [Actinia tenebrosa]